MVVGRNRDAQLIIDEDAIYANIHSEKQRLADDSEMFMVVKANAYGHGAVQVAQIAKEAGATGFCVAILDEAIQLREAGFVSEPILVLGLTDLSDLPLIYKYDVSVTVSSADWIKQAAELGRQMHFTHKIKTFLALDTGMGRIGLQTPAEVTDYLQSLHVVKNQIEFQGVYTHFATADEVDDKYFDFQLQNFKDLMAAIPNKPRYVSVANSATSLWHHVTGANMIRYGVAGYGLNPSGTAIEAPFTLQPALSFTSELIYVKKVASGRSIGYGATYNVDKPQWVGTIPVGYADGVCRRMKGFKVLIDGNYCPIIGRVCMDQVMVRLPYEMKLGTKVTFVGTQAGKTITLQDVAEYCGTINYEIACGFSDRLPRVYYSKKN
ncbi:alanine racemase [Fructilactobacillus lindneri]|uniref:Alanine racemase n=2 Tax=Fructilactobacillus lindneri TaxID=53444 RepID=A0A0R2K3R5_9LACO|nr:alanine racemase [Fructilactobacillus lindneri]ANZ57331.1 alanine racemase [Fructilactobacillus lindneri]ANZ58596.1 alanine racemase [Fructilactobacillus lindneri]KRN80733.1 alanine racemase [Fructilactobacillus lindneri DSM 20690 = JCM 11027]POG97634.1 alanine racemase [Fructilactobacillus lindneri]POG98971.1 alanine racemase [Fructilactobacillus lindneri]